MYTRLAKVSLDSSPPRADSRIAHVWPTESSQTRDETSKVTIRSVATEPLQALLQRAFPEATELSVVDRTGGGDHFQVTVASTRFEGLSLVDQHRLVYDALSSPLQDGTIHELRIKTKGTA